MLLSEDERAPLKAIDFGLAVPYEPSELPLTNLGLEGTPWFMVGWGLLGFAGKKHKTPKEKELRGTLMPDGQSKLAQHHRCGHSHRCAQDVHLQQVLSCYTLACLQAPEVLSSQVGPASDVWSAGVMAAQLLTGRLPFDDHRNPSSPSVAAIW
jgi:calcium-dependent protein kinase